MVKKKSLLKRKKYQKSQNLTKHGVGNQVVIATSITLGKNFFKKSYSPIKFSKSGKISQVLLK